MAARKYVPQDNRYIYGNTARKTAPVQRPERPERTPGTRPKSQVHQHTIRRNQEKALQMNLPYLVALTIASICTLYLCINYLQIQSSITTRIHNIAQLEKRLEKKKSENDALATHINTSVDLDYIYKAATQDLGMVYANKDQIILYDKTESEYVRQYEDIPNN